MEPEEKAALLEFAIRVNELSNETMLGGLQKKNEELDQMNSTESDNSN